MAGAKVSAIFISLCSELYCCCSTLVVLLNVEDNDMNQTISMSIRVSEQELEKLKKPQNCSLIHHIVNL